MMFDDFQLKVERLYCERDEKILFSDLNMAVRPGDLWQVEGPNGSGKSTLLRILTGLSSDFEGKVLWNSRLINSVAADFRQKLLYSGHCVGVKLALTAQENLRWFFALHSHISLADINRALAAVGLKGYEDTPCHQLSAGQQRRVALARLQLATQPLWILDEPFTAIDHAAVQALELQLAQHVRQGGAVIFTSHHGFSDQSIPLKRLSLGSVRDFV